MTYPTTLIVAALLCSTAAATEQEVTCESPCECSSAHGKGRWLVKNDPSIPPTDASAIQSVTPSDMFSWPGPNVRLTQQSERTGIENKWFALTGRVVAVTAETDGDPHTGLSLHGDLIISLKVFRSSTGSTTVPADSDKYFKIFLAI